MFASILGCSWIAINNTAGVITFVLIYGFCSGGIAGLSISLIVPVCPDLRQFGVRLGMMLIPVSLGLLLGNPIAGALEAHGWLGLQLFTGIVQGLAFVVICAVKLVLYGIKWEYK